jgi:S-DNA-T family DNA segregation ATPase FtsK/SpoIIIE
LSRGRAAGFIIVVATQKPSHDVVPTWIRDLFSYRIALRCTSKEASDTILGQGWATRGFSASSINPDHRGVAYLLAEGGVPHRIRITHLTDIDLAVLAHRAEMLRGGL